MKYREKVIFGNPSLGTYKGYVHIYSPGEDFMGDEKFINVTQQTTPTKMKSRVFDHSGIFPPLDMNIDDYNCMVA